ncbi:Pentatricopeptide repeat-containing protein, chloroplastic [Ananas comosus]|uniref:Pentatricopeptide repeat-containing protein, chloroplastic n=1 Tax=Ananas comosus TaxID=4615 RepID=A0A199VYR3_ANACO|nr:Pentatricopeptide repeat-containing protein, chloroplastic [Ananas comosus]
MYGKYGDMVKGRLVFDRMPSRDVVSWNSLLAGYERNKQFGYGLPSDPVVPDSCKIGREIHALPKSLEVLVCNALLSMYAKNGRLVDAEKIFIKWGCEIPTLGMQWSAVLHEWIWR